jgi:tRNA G18 (ribose-2'-O)-methylase SpoU
MVYDPSSPHYEWKRNVVDEFVDLSNDEIRNELRGRCNNFSVMMAHVVGDFNIGTVVRSLNFLGGREFFYYGKKRFDRRSCVGVHNYTDVNFLDCIEGIVELKKKYSLVGLENNVGRGCLDLRNFDWKLEKDPCIVVGEECRGLDDEILDLCDVLVEIKNFGSVRSLNVGVAAGIAMGDFVGKRNKILNM